ncbi:excinuclease ABC subunit A [Lujinxingia litoralis]|uniref:UvrABC system protein A n=1 Tax=Lujinxingia litoralis TaxID=2211119 RepID=A0A328C9N9_9DELT|nr:excinuclease ABC subunit UvrA [Lujinxingia litoralis]RAL23704.1 excinuclease ABC subunit A [Lujinxingia litoralis]
MDAVRLKGVRTHNLKNIACVIPHYRLTVVTGVSGSGKSSLAFDTLYAEGQRRYTESLSTYARQFLDRLPRPPIDVINHVPPAIALRQKNEVSNARSTVGTVTEIDDHLHLIYTHVGVTYCPTCEIPVGRDNPAEVVDTLLQELEEGARVILVARVAPEEASQRALLLEHLVGQGYRRLYIEGQTLDVTESGVESLLDMESFPVVVDRLALRHDDRMRIAEAVEAAMGLGRGRVEVYEHRSEQPPRIFDQAFRCNSCGLDLMEPQPALFSFNSSVGACPTCTGFGKTMGVDYAKVIPNPRVTLEEGAVACFQTPKYRTQHKKLLGACRDAGIPIDIPYGDLVEEHKQYIRYGGKGYPGLAKFFKSLHQKQHRTDVRIMLARYRGYDLCEDCQGTRLHPNARNVRFAGRLISDFWEMRIEQALAFFDVLELEPSVRARIAPLLDEITHRLLYLHEVGLGYLEMGRQSRTLSGGEMQRIHLTSSLGRALTDTLYVLDEPTAGLHARDSQKLLEVLRGLRDLGNTVVVVEHDPEIIEGADHVLELGPVGGEGGGALTYQGPLSGFDLEARVDFSECEAMAARVEGPPPGQVRIVGARHHNLKDISVAIPHERITAVTGVSGSGKSTLMEDVLFNGWRRMRGQGGVEAGHFEALEGLEGFADVEMMDQSAIGRSSRSNAMSYTKAYDDIRKIFSGTQDARRAGLTMGDFSFNTSGGRCEVCEGTGTVTVELHFMADVEVPCDECGGKRFGPRVLGVRYRGKTIDEVFELTVDEAVTFFEGHAALLRKLKPLQEVGLGYLRLGQTTATYSGGEAQRLKLATYIADGRKRGETEPVLFIFDEPTVGLHLKDVSVLLVALRKLVELGHTVIAVEHNTDFIARCDHVVDLGPEAGPGGGQVVAAGSPQEVAGVAASVTGRYLRELLEARARRAS